MRYWVHHESCCVWITDNEISEYNENIEFSEIDEIHEIDEDTYLNLILKGYTT